MAGVYRHGEQHDLRVTWREAANRTPNKLNYHDKSVAG